MRVKPYFAACCTAVILFACLSGCTSKKDEASSSIPAPSVSVGSAPSAFTSQAVSGSSSSGTASAATSEIVLVTSKSPTAAVTSKQAVTSKTTAVTSKKPETVPNVVSKTPLPVTSKTPVTSAKSSSKAPVAPPAVDSKADQYEQEVLRLVNQERQKAGVSPRSEERR